MILLKPSLSCFVAGEPSNNFQILVYLYLPLDNALHPWYSIYLMVHTDSTYLKYIDLSIDKGAQDAFFPFCEDAERET